MSARDAIKNAVGYMVKWALLASNNGLGRGSVQGPEANPELGEKNITQDVRILQQFGFRSTAPVKNTETATIAARAGSANAIVVASDNFSLGPNDLKEGESAMYCEKGALIKQDTAGKITIDASSPADVQVNGGTLEVARRTDPTSTGSKQWFAFPDPMTPGNVIWQVITETEQGVVQSLAISIPSAQILGSPYTTNNPIVLPEIGEITSGAPRFKA